jgi:hypothetical protein
MVGEAGLPIRLCVPEMRFVVGNGEDVDLAGPGAASVGNSVADQ